MSGLHSKIAHLADDNPDLRVHLVPLLKQADASDFTAFLDIRVAPDRIFINPSFVLNNWGYVKDLNPDISKLLKEATKNGQALIMELESQPWDITFSRWNGFHPNNYMLFASSGKVIINSHYELTLIGSDVVARKVKILRLAKRLFSNFKLKIH